MYLRHYSLVNKNQKAIDTGLGSDNPAFIRFDLENKYGWDDIPEDALKEGIDKGSGYCCYTYATNYMPNSEHDVPKDKRDEVLSVLKKGAMLGDSDCMLMYAVISNRSILNDLDCCDVALWYVAAHAKGNGDFFFRAMDSLGKELFDIPESLYF